MVHLTKQEYARFMSIVNTNFKRFNKNRYYTILFDDKYIAFEVKNFCDYKIIKVGRYNENN